MTQVALHCVGIESHQTITMRTRNPSTGHRQSALLGLSSGGFDLLRYVICFRRLFDRMSEILAQHITSARGVVLQSCVERRHGCESDECHQWREEKGQRSPPQWIAVLLRGNESSQNP